VTEEAPKPQPEWITLTILIAEAKEPEFISYR
jgi:hypothetical protein